MSNLRTLKIYAKFQRLGNFKNKVTPQINLSGDWLKKAGFQMGKQVFITVEDGKLVIVNDERRISNV